MKTTRHGAKRVRKRIGIKKKVVDKIRDKAFVFGIKHSEAKGKLNNYFDYLWYQNPESTNIRMYANYVWIFCGERLVTVFPVPTSHKKSVLRMLKKRRIFK